MAGPALWCLTYLGVAAASPLIPAGSRVADFDSAPQQTPGSGANAAALNPLTINNNAVFALFGVLGAGLVLTSIWFFFWAKNGSFRFRKGDWEDYKSTVLRRKGPNGTTLSGATKTTVLGGGSVVGSQATMSYYGDPEKAEELAQERRSKIKKDRRNGRDEDVRAYRTERVARVGGMNREADGAYHDHSTEGSSLAGSQPVHTAGRSRDTVRPVGGGNPPMRQYSFNAGTEVSFSSDKSRRPLNRHSQPSPAAGAPPKRASGAPRHGRQPERASMPGSFYEPLDFDSRHGGSDLGDRNTKAYFHPIPGLGSAANGASAGRGFRRGGGGGGRRDSLSDSGDEATSYRS